MAAGRFANKVAVVTGAGSGIGRAIAQRVLAEGGSVVAGDVVHDGIAALEASFSERCVAANCDVTVERDVAALVATAVDRFGAIHAGFNVAGGGRGGPLHELAEQDWDWTIDLCLKGVFLSMKHEAAQMIRQGLGGAIVNIASLNSRVPMHFGGAYSAAKAGVVSLSQTGALELGEHRIRVSAVSPGLTATPLVQAVMDLPAAHQAYLDRIPLGRAATPEDVAASATFLASDDGAYISGVNLFVDGGWEQTAYPDLRPFADQLMADEAG